MKPRVDDRWFVLGSGSLCLLPRLGWSQEPLQIPRLPLNPFEGISLSFALALGIVIATLLVLAYRRGRLTRGRVLAMTGAAGLVLAMHKIVEYFWAT